MFRSGLIGLPEVAPEKYQSTLVTQGIYSRVRHPRYVEMLLGKLAHALFTNYLAAYGVFALSVAGLALIVRLEERELCRNGRPFVRRAGVRPRSRVSPLQLYVRRAGAVPQSFPG